MQPTCYMLLLASSFTWSQAEKKEPVDSAWIEKVAALNAKEQVKEVVAKLHEINFKLPESHTVKIEDDKVIEFAFSGNGLREIGPLAAFKHLRKLSFAGTPPTSELDKERVRDLKALIGLPLVELNMSWSLVKDLSPLKGMKLTVFDCSSSPVESLVPIKGAPLE